MQAPDPDHPFVLRSLELQNIRCFERLSLHFEEPEADVGQWTVLLGDNGTGKTTILRSLAMVTASARVAEPLLEQIGSEWVRGHTGYCSLSTTKGPFGQVFSARGGFVYGVEDDDLVLGKHKRSRDAFPFVVAYGAGRGSALGGPDREVRLNGQREGRATLFHAGSLVHAETWLRNLAFASTREKSDQRFFESVLETLVALLPGVDQIEVDPQDVWVSGPSVGSVSLPALSDGFLTTLGWTVDLIARWAHLARETSSLDADFRQQMTGLVLIDELDLHLHPRWQTQVIAQLREAFPRLSFVATTHNAMTLRGTKPGEVHVLQREGDAIHARQIDVPPGTRADDLLTGRWFGLQTTLDDDTVGKLSAYQEKLRSKASADELRELEDELRGRLGTFADTPEERVALELVAESGGARQLDAAARSSLKERMRERLAKKG